MNGIKRLLIGFVTVAAMSAFADTKIATTSSSDNRLEALFKADLQYRSESQSDAWPTGGSKDALSFHGLLQVRCSGTAAN